MNLDQRHRIILDLRTAGQKADLLIENYLGNPGGPSGCKPYTRNSEVALTLLPPNTHFLCGRFEGGTLFWCDVGFRPQVQAWGDTLAAAIAGAIFAYRTHPDVLSGLARGRQRPESGSSAV